MIRKALAVVAFVGAAIVLPRLSGSAVLYLDWADEFLGASVSCELDTPSGGYCTPKHYWDDSSSDEPPEWTYVGQQGASSGGRANAKEKVMVQWYEASSGCSSVTFNLARRKVVPAPSSGSSCTGQSSSYVGSVSYTKNSCVFNNEDWDISNRLKPIYDFSQETASAGTSVGYRSTLTATDNISSSSNSITGCYKIYWF